jgi:uracil-DNA glycosylase family 4
VSELKTVLTHLETLLAQLDDAGIRHLSVRPEADPSPGGDVAAPGRASWAPVAESLSDSGGDWAERPVEVGPGNGLPGADEGPLSALVTLEALNFRVRDCQACKLAPTRKRLVFGTGAARPKLLFIGEGPGAEEDQQGLPFVGRAGQVLTGLISALALTRADVYITNVVKCRPPGNRTPEPDEVASCRPILLRQVELLDPRLIVTLGNVPLKALNPQAGGITKERGRTFSFQRWTVLPTFHPSYLLRNPRDLSLCWQDFRHAFGLAYGEAKT